MTAGDSASFALTRLELAGFRSYQHLDWRPRPGITLLAGCNGAGKTNLLEAVHYAALLRSFRTRNLQELRHWASPGFSLTATLGGTDGVRQLRVVQQQERVLQVDSIPVTRASDFINHFLAVAFIPEDIGLVKGPGSERRRFLDILGSQLDGGYLRILSDYGQVLRQRNALLRQHARFGDHALEAFDQQLVTLGAAIIQRRLALVDDLQPELEASGRQFFTGGTLLARYGTATGPEPAPDVLAARLLELLLKSRDREKRDGVTLVGPHRDDLLLTLDSRPLAAFGSEGQCRTTALTLRLASYRLLQRHAEQRRGLILLVDDVLGELDGTRRRTFLDLIRRCPQALITVTDTPEYAPWADQVAMVHDGKVDG